MNIVVIALYHFFDFPHFANQREETKRFFVGQGIKGTLLLTPEGINGTLAGSREAVNALINYIKNHIIQEDFEYKESLCEVMPFKRTKVKLKKETISIGESAPLAKRGHYLDYKEWNELISEEDTIILDTRNAYEVEIGTFEGAIDPGIRTFKQLPAFVRDKLGDAKNKKIATFCTGGIRCEKFTAWMLDQGYENVYHLKGGILKYLEKVPRGQSKWNGACFVFDERAALGHGLEPHN